MITLSTKWKDVLQEQGVLYRCDPQVIVRMQPKRLRCEYCGRIALTDRPTCEGCGAVLPWEIQYEA